MGQLPKITSDTGTHVLVDANGKVLQVSYRVSPKGARGNGYTSANVPAGADKGHLRSVNEGGNLNPIDDGILNIIGQTVNVNRGKIKRFENFRKGCCMGAEVKHTLLENEYVRVQTKGIKIENGVPKEVSIDVTYNPLSTISKDKWPDNWFEVPEGVWH